VASDELNKAPIKLTSFPPLFTECLNVRGEASYHAFTVRRFRCRLERFPVLGNQQTGVYFANRQFLFTEICIYMKLRQLIHYVSVSLCFIRLLSF